MRVGSACVTPASLLGLVPGLAGSPILVSPGLVDVRPPGAPLAPSPSVCWTFCQAVASGEADLESWAGFSDVDLRSRLSGLPGVGAKVANCVMLFAYERLRAFPIDVWNERVLREKYFPRRRKLTATKLREFCDSYFGEHGGYAQQYLFHHARKTAVRTRRR